MHAFGVRSSDRGFVGRDVAQYRTPDDKERRDQAHAAPQLDLVGSNRLDRLAVAEIVAAPGFAVELQFGRDVFSKFPRQPEHLGGVAALELQFELADRDGSVSRPDLPFIERDLDAASVPAYRPAGAANPR